MERESNFEARYAKFHSNFHLQLLFFYVLIHIIATVLQLSVFES